MQNEPAYPYKELAQAGNKETYPMNPSAPVVTTPSATQAHVLLGPENTVTVCPFCKASVKTAVRYTTTSRTHMAAALCGFICCCCCIPYCSESAKNSDHFCPNCQKYLGTYEK